MKFEWDERKNQANIAKHGFDFADAGYVFDGPIFVSPDTLHSNAEDRWIALGLSRGRIVVVIYTERDDGNTIRIISMRKALKHEQKHFEQVFSD